MSEGPVVLIVDDERQIRRLLRYNLEGDGYRVYESASGREGLERAAALRPDLIILDLGLPAKSIPRVFDKFYRGPDAPAGGTGLGLSIARGFVTAHGGTIAAQNMLKGGARFTIHLPLGTPPELPPEKEPQ